MPYKRYVRKRKTFRKKSIGKKQYYRKRKIMRAFTKPDGINVHKFVYTADITAAAAASTGLGFGWSSNVNTAAIA